MSNLPGNPHAENVELVLLQTVLSSDDSGTQTIESLLMDNANATLALAFEQRTANLIALADLTMHGGLNPDYDIKTIYNRLGVGDTK